PAGTGIDGGGSDHPPVSREESGSPLPIGEGPCPRPRRSGGPSAALAPRVFDEAVACSSHRPCPARRDRSCRGRRRRSLPADPASRIPPTDIPPRDTILGEGQRHYDSLHIDSSFVHAEWVQRE